MKKIFILIFVFVVTLGCVNIVKAVPGEVGGPYYGVNPQDNNLDFGSEEYDYSTSGNKISPQYNQSNNDGSTLELPNPLKDNTVMEVVNRLLGYLLIFSLPIAIGIIMYAGYLMITAQGDASKVKKAWDTIKQVLIGLMVIFLSKSIVWLVINILSGEF